MNKELGSLRIDFLSAADDDNDEVEFVSNDTSLLTVTRNGKELYVSFFGHGGEEADRLLCKISLSDFESALEEARQLMRHD